MEVSPLTVHGNWRRASSSAESDLNAQTITGVHTPCALLVAPDTARSTTSPTIDNAIDDFFGMTRPRVTRESRHDSYPPLDLDILPPPYADADLPAYSSDPDIEPVTLAMHLFKFGFLFPPFWVLGTIIWTSPLSVPASFEPSKPEPERQQLVQTIRVVELKWAKRCVWALLALLVLVGAVAGISIAVWYS